MRWHDTAQEHGTDFRLSGSSDDPNDLAVNATSNGGKKNGTDLRLSSSSNDTASNATSPMQDAKQRLKDAQNAVAQMMAGNQFVTTSQVGGNVSLALNAMNNLMVSMG